MSMMKLLLYASDGLQRERLLHAINVCNHQCSLETVADLETLDRRLRQNSDDDIWLVMISKNAQELDRLTTMSELILNVRSILVLPDRRRETAVVGHTLYPRFISYLDGDFSDVGTVLGTVILKNKRKHSNHQ